MGCGDEGNAAQKREQHAAPTAVELRQKQQMAVQSDGMVGVAVGEDLLRVLFQE